MADLSTCNHCLSQVTWDPPDMLKRVHLGTSLALAPPIRKGPWSKLQTWRLGNSSLNLFKPIQYIVITSADKRAVGIQLKCLLVYRCKDFQKLRWFQGPYNNDDWEHHDFYDQLVMAEVTPEYIKYHRIYRKNPHFSSGKQINKH